MVLYAVVIAIVVGAAIFAGIDVFLALKTAKAAPGYFNIGYKPEYDGEFYRAHRVGVIVQIGHKMLYLVEIHPEDAAKAHAWTVPERELRGVYSLKKGRFYRYAFKEELYD